MYDYIICISLPPLTIAHYSCPLPLVLLGGWMSGAGQPCTTCTSTLLACPYTEEPAATKNLLCVGRVESWRLFVYYLSLSFAQLAVFRKHLPRCSDDRLETRMEKLRGPRDNLWHNMSRLCTNLASTIRALSIVHILGLALLLNPLYFSHAS